MKRGKPTKRLVLELTGPNNGLISNTHHGLADTRVLQFFYPFLDFDELVAFAASSFKSREKGDYSFRRIVSAGNVYNIFSEAYEIGMPWLNKNRALSPEMAKKLKKLCPFDGKDLADRLNSVDSEHVDRLRAELQEQAAEFVFYCQYYDRKAMRGGDNYKLEVMNFHNAYPPSRRKGDTYFRKMMKEMLGRFASEIARIVKEYPDEIGQIRT